jgi:hypothetical protein
MHDRRPSVGELLMTTIDPAAETGATLILSGPAPLEADRTDHRSFKLVEILEGRRGLAGLRFPVLVSRPGCAIEEIETSTVHAIANLPARPAPDGTATLPDELGRILLGRTAENDLALEEVTISRRHASLIVRERGTWSIVDDGSLNGTFVDGERLMPRAPLLLSGPIATLRIGSKCRFAFMDEGAFRDHLVTLGAALTEQRTRTTTVGRSAPQPDARDDHAAARILEAAQTAPVPAKSLRVALPGALLEEFDEWADFVAFVERNAGRIEQVEVAPDDGRGVVVYRRASTTDLALPRVERPVAVHRSA